MMYKWFKKHWFVNTIFFTIPSIWFSVFIGILGKRIGLVNGSGTLTLLGYLLTALVVVAIFVINGMKNYYECKTEGTELSNLENKLTLAEALEDSMRLICQAKVSCVRGVISNVMSDKQEVPIVFTNPENQLSRMLEKLTSMMCLVASKKGYKFQECDFYITLAYQFPEESETWYWLEGTPENTLSIYDLTRNDNLTTFNYLLHSKSSFYFNNSKEEAKSKGHYMYDEQDETNAVNGKDVGSIFCRKYEVKTNGTIYIRAMLSISTNSKRFVRLEGNESDQAKIDSFRDNLAVLSKDSFGDRICLELGLLYLKYADKE